MIKLPNSVDKNNLIDNLRIFSWEAADCLLHYSQIFKEGGHTSHIIKTDKKEDPVTIADLKVNEMLIRRIKNQYKNVNWGILSEENVKVGERVNNDKFDWLWVLDPLDGTKDFIQATGNYAMHLALNYKNKPYLGVVLILRKKNYGLPTRIKYGLKKEMDQNFKQI